MPILNTTVKVEYAYKITNAQFRKALLNDLIQSCPFSHLSEFHRKLSFDLECFGSDFIFTHPVTRDQFSTDTESASAELHKITKEWFPNKSPEFHSIRMEHSFGRDELIMAFAFAFGFFWIRKFNFKGNSFTDTGNSIYGSH